MKLNLHDEDGDFRPMELRLMNVTESMWHETPEEIEAGLAWGLRKKRMLRWVRRQATARLCPIERQCLELHYFRGLSLADIARLTKTNPSSVHRAIRRSIRKLRGMAEKSKMRKNMGI